MVRVIYHAHRLTVPVGILQCRWHEICLRIHAAVVAQCERVVKGWLANRAPEVDDLVALGKKLRGIFDGQVTIYARLRRVVRLVDVHALDGLALLRGVFKVTRAAASDSYGRRIRIDAPVNEDSWNAL